MKFPDAPAETRPGRVMPRVNLWALDQSVPAVGRNGMTVFTYRSDLGLSDIRSPRFFNDARHKMKRGDFIMVDAKDGGAFLFVSRVTADSIWVADIGSVFAPRSETDDPR